MLKKNGIIRLIRAVRESQCSVKKEEDKSITVYSLSVNICCARSVREPAKKERSDGGSSWWRPSFRKVSSWLIMLA